MPAHDEERLIADTVDHLLALDYPREMFDVHVVADHCSDATAEIARDHGANVLENTDPGVRGKGAALGWAFDRLDSEGAIRDVVVLVDADTSAGRGLLRAFDRRFAAGAVAVQAYYAVRDPAATPGGGDARRGAGRAPLPAPARTVQPRRELRPVRQRHGVPG